MFTPSTLFRSRMMLVVALAAVLAAAPSVVRAQNKLWTTVGSAGTADEESLLFVTLADATARVTEWAPAGTIGVIRYNVVAVEGLFQNAGIGLTARFVDGADTDQVLIQLRQIELETGAVETLLQLDSDNFPASYFFQVQRICKSDVVFDFERYAYYVEARLTKSKGPQRGGRGGLQLLRAPAISMVQITGSCALQ